MKSILAISKYWRHFYEWRCSVFAYVTSNLFHFSIYVLVSSSKQCACNASYMDRTSITIYILLDMNDILLPPIIYNYTVSML